MLVIQISRHCSEQILARQWEVKGKSAKLMDREQSQVMTEEITFQGVAWKLSGIQHSGQGWEVNSMKVQVHSTSQERWITVNENVLESDFVPLCDGTTRRRCCTFLMYFCCTSEIYSLFFSHCDGWLREFGLCFPYYLYFCETGNHGWIISCS